MDFNARLELIKTAFTCPICKRICGKVTIIEECSHRFCQKCITRKIKQENISCCPVCNQDMGSAPLQKLSLDHKFETFLTNFFEKRKDYMERGLIGGNASLEPDLDSEATQSEGSTIPLQVMVGVTTHRCLEKSTPICFSLIASDKQDVDPKLPQIQPFNLKVQDPKLMATSFIKKHLVEKLCLKSENEVEVYLNGHALIPNWKLQDVHAMWLQTMPESRRTISMCSSGKDSVMVLSYGRIAKPG